MSVFYTHVAKRKEEILVRVIDSNSGKRAQYAVPFKPTLYLKASEGVQPDAKSIKGENLSRIDFEDLGSMWNFIKEYKHVGVYGNKEPISQFINKNFPGKIEYNPDLINGAHIDIEVFSGGFGPNGEPVSGPFPEQETAEFPINAITMYSTKEDKFYTYGLEQFEGREIGKFNPSALQPEIQKRLEGMNIEYVGYDTEHRLLNAFLDKWVELQLDYYSGWNSGGFDMVYLVNRIEKICGKGASKRLSPWGWIKHTTFRDRMGEHAYCEVVGIADLDLKNIMDKHGFIKPHNWKLQTVAQLLLGEGKLSFEEEGNLNKLYLLNYNLFIAYNLIDVRLVNKLDKKKNLIRLTFGLSYITKSNYEDGVGTVKPWSYLLADMLNGLGLQPEIKNPGKLDKKIPGGFVRSPNPGKYRWVISFDYDSLERRGFAW